MEHNVPQICPTPALLLYRLLPSFTGGIFTDNGSTLALQGQGALQSGFTVCTRKHISNVKRLEFHQRRPLRGFAYL